jgi:hypothetical protein
MKLNTTGPTLSYMQPDESKIQKIQIFKQSSLKTHVFKPCVWNKPQDPCIWKIWWQVGSFLVDRLKNLD